MHDGADEIGTFAAQRLRLFLDRGDERSEADVAGIGDLRRLGQRRAGQADAHAADLDRGAVSESGQRPAVAVAHVGGVKREARLAHALEEDLLAEIEFVIAGHEDVGQDHVDKRDDMIAAVDARQQRGRKRVAGMGENDVAAGGRRPRAFGLDHGGKTREAAALAPVRPGLLVHQIDVVDQDEGDGRGLGRGETRQAREHCKAGRAEKQQAAGNVHFTV